MSSPIPQEENQGINTDKRKDAEKIVDPEKPSGKFTKKHFLIALAIVIVLALGTGIGLLVVFIPKNNYVAVTIVNQRDDFTQKDEICVYQESEKMLNCTEVHINSTRVTVDQNDQNTTNLIFLQNLKLRQYKTQDDGTKDYTELTEQNSQIEQNLKKRLRFLQASNSSDLCENNSTSECGNVNQVPLLTFVTDQETGDIIKIGIPSEVDQSLVEPLISSIVHVGANTQNASETESTNGTRRVMLSEMKNLYKVGKLTFLPKYSITKQQAGNIVITKKISKTDNIGNGEQMNSLKQFDQQQDTILDVNKKLTQSRIQTSLIVDNTITSDSQEENSSDQTQIQSDSNLITVSTKSDEELTSLLSDIQKQQTVYYYSISELQEKLTDNSDDPSQDKKNDNFTENIDTITQSNQEEGKTQNEGGTRLLQDENGEMYLAEDYQYQETQGQCDNFTFSQTRKLSEVTVFRRKVSLITELKGTVAQSQISYSLSTCIALQGVCALQIQKIDQSFSGQQTPNLQLANIVNNQKLFDLGILLLGYTLNTQAQVQAIQSQTRQYSKSVSSVNLLNGFNSQINLNAYTSLSIVKIINIKAGVSGGVFKGDIKANSLFQIDPASNKIIPAKYQVTLDVAKQASNVAIFGQYQKINARWEKCCFKKGWIKICYPCLQISYSKWVDIFRKDLPALSRPISVQLFKLKSKCMA